MVWSEARERIPLAASARRREQGSLAAGGPSDRTGRLRAAVGHLRLIDGTGATASAHQRSGVVTGERTGVPSLAHSVGQSSRSTCSRPISTGREHFFSDERVCEVAVVAGREAGDLGQRRVGALVVSSFSTGGSR